MEGVAERLRLSGSRSPESGEDAAVVDVAILPVLAVCVRARAAPDVAWAWRARFSSLSRAEPEPEPALRNRLSLSRALRSRAEARLSEDPDRPVDGADPTLLRSP